MTQQAVLWKAGTAITTGIAGVTINNGAGYLGSAVDNSANLDQNISLVLTWTGTATPTAGNPWSIYILYALDGTNYEDGGTGVQPRKGPAAVIGAVADTSAHVESRVLIPVAPFKYKLLVWNGSGTNSASSSVTVTAYASDDAIQASA